MSEDHPFRERLWSLLAISQFQTLRQADSLSTLRTLRVRLADELGVDPSAELRRLSPAVLNQSPDLAAAAAIPLPRPAAATSEAPASPSELIGRTGDLAIVTAAVDRLRNGSGGTVIISGDAGIGKSRLASATAAYAAAHGVAVVVGRCHEADVSPAYWPWLPVLRTLATPDAPAEVRDLLEADVERQQNEAGASALRSYDAVCRLLRGAGRPAAVAGRARGSALGRRLVAATAGIRGGVGVRTMYSSSARADPRVPAPPTHSPRHSPPWHGHGASRIRLEGLDDDDVARLFEAEVGPYAYPLAGAIARRTGGNPFYVIEFGRLMRSRMITDPWLIADIDVPEGIRDVLRLRLHRLPITAGIVLAVAAVAGSVDPQLIKTVSQDRRRRTCSPRSTPHRRPAWSPRMRAAIALPTPSSGRPSTPTCLSGSECGCTPVSPRLSPLASRPTPRSRRSWPITTGWRRPWTLPTLLPPWRIYERLPRSPTRATRTSSRPSCGDRPRPPAR